MANLVARFVVADIQDQGNKTEVLLRPAVAADNPNGTENDSLWSGYPDFDKERVKLNFKSGAANPFVKNGQVVATFAAG